VIERKVEISHEKYAVLAYVCQFTITTLKMSTVTTKVSNTGRGSTGSPATRRKPISEDGSSHQTNEGGFEELNIPTEPEQK
jgi:hypothetical protein